MKRNSLSHRIGLVAILALTMVIAIASVAQAACASEQKDVSVPVILINTVTAFFILTLGLWITYLTRGGFLSLGFVLITIGITIGWVAKLGVEFLADSGILVTTFDVVGVAEAVGGIILVAGFILLSQKLRS